MTTAASKAAFELLCSKLRDISSLRYRLPPTPPPQHLSPQPPHSSVSSILDWDTVTSLPPAGSLPRCTVAPASSSSHASSSHELPRRPKLGPFSRHSLQMHRPRTSAHPARPPSRCNCRLVPARSRHNQRGQSYGDDCVSLAIFPSPS